MKKFLLLGFCLSLSLTAFPGLVRAENGGQSNGWGGGHWQGQNGNWSGGQRGNWGQNGNRANDGDREKRRQERMERFRAMSPEERQQFMEKRRERMERFAAMRNGNNGQDGGRFQGQGHRWDNNNFQGGNFNAGGGNFHPRFDHRNGGSGSSGDSGDAGSDGSGTDSGN